MTPNETSRLILRPFTTADAGFIFNLLNSDGWLEYIGNRGIHDLDGARNYISERLTEGNDRGYGCFCITRRDDGTALGLLSLLQRDYLDAPDVGYALLPEFYGNGYALEATVTLLDHCAMLCLSSVYAIVSPGNQPSERLLKKLGFRFKRSIEQNCDHLFCYVKHLTPVQSA